MPGEGMGRTLTNGRIASRSVFGVDTNLDLGGVGGALKHGIASKAGGLAWAWAWAWLDRVVELILNCPTARHDVTAWASVEVSKRSIT